MRDKLVHEYWAIDQQLGWQVIQRNLPQLKGTIISIMENVTENE